MKSIEILIAQSLLKGSTVLVYGQNSGKVFLFKEAQSWLIQKLRALQKQRPVGWLYKRICEFISSYRSWSAAAKVIGLRERYPLKMIPSSKNTKITYNDCKTDLLKASKQKWMLCWEETLFCLEFSTTLSRVRMVWRKTSQRVKTRESLALCYWQRSNWRNSALIAKTWETYCFILNKDFLASLNLYRETINIQRWNLFVKNNECNNGYIKRSEILNWIKATMEKLIYKLLAENLLKTMVNLKFSFQCVRVCDLDWIILHRSQYADGELIKSLSLQ